MFRYIFYNFFPDILSNLYFRYGIRLIPISKEEIDIADIKRVCVLVDAGVENVIMIKPMLKTLRNSIENLKIILVVDSDDAKTLMENIPLADKIFVLNDAVKKNKVLRQIRSEWLDLTIAATRRTYANAKIAFQTGSIYRIGFRYDYMTHKEADFFFTHPVSFKSSKDRIEQNLDLIRPLGLCNYELRITSYELKEESLHKS